MRRMAEIACMRRGHVLEIGFGMGISCDEVQKLKPRSHTIVEAHPEIVERAQAWAAARENVSIIAGRWQDRLSEISARGPYDGISFDVFGGSGQRESFFSELPRLLAPGGCATLWLADDHALPASLARVLEAGGYRWHLTPVTAIPDKRCTYSRTNSFMIPIITQA